MAPLIPSFDPKNKPQSKESRADPALPSYLGLFAQDKNKTMQLQDFHRVLSLWDLTLPFSLTTHMSCCFAALQLSRVLSIASSQEKDAGSKESIAEGGGRRGHAQGGLTCKGPSEDWILCSGISETGM